MPGFATQPTAMLSEARRLAMAAPYRVWNGLLMDGVCRYGIRKRCARVRRLPGERPH